MLEDMTTSLLRAISGRPIKSNSERFEAIKEVLVPQMPSENEEKFTKEETNS